MMRNNKYILHLVFFALIALTAGTALAGNATLNDQFSRAGILMALSFAKIMLIGWWFMELHQAHRAWKMIFIIIVLLITGAILLIS
jgi:hypothetical protein